MQPDAVRQTCGAGHKELEEFRMGERREGSKISRVCWVDSIRPTPHGQAGAAYVGHRCRAVRSWIPMKGIVLHLCRIMN